MGQAATTLSLLGMAVLLGLRHGYDADHLSVIDGLVRRNVRARPGLARAAGLLFSLGHGLVVTVVACAALLAARRWTPAPWLETVAALASAGVLVALAILNLRNLLLAPRDRAVAPVGFRSRPLRALLASDRPATLAGLGILFAIAPDSLTIATGLGLAASTLGGWGGGLGGALSAAGCFTSGMVLASGINGWFVARMVLASDRRGAIGARIMTGAVALTSTAVAGSILAGLLRPRSAPPTLFESGWGGAIVIGVVLAAFALSLLVARWPCPGGPLRAAVSPPES